MNVKKYTESHEWVEVEEMVGTVGISIHAQKELGDIVYVEFPKLQKMVKAGEEAAVLESTKAAADVYSPISGEIIEINHQLKDSCNAINHSPEGEGWLFKVKLSNPQELNHLIEPADYLKKV
ncbi:MAG: glycine cleavage system protein GcvH [Parachlamydiaceae bacterium]